MPFALADLVAIALAVAELVAAAIAAALVGWLITRIPNPSLLGWHPLAFIPDLLRDFQSFLEGIADKDLLVIRDLIADTAHIFHWLFKVTVAALDHAFVFIDHINNAVVPNAVSSAVHDLTTLINGNQLQEENDHKSAMAAAAAAAAIASGVAASIGKIDHGTVEGDITAADNDATQRAGTYTDSKVGALAEAMEGDFSGVWAAIGPLQTAVNTSLPAEIAKAAGTEATQEASDQQTDAAALQATATALSDQISAAVAAGDTATIDTLQPQLDAINQKIATLQATTAITLPGLQDVSIPTDLTVPVAVGALAGALAGVITEVDNCMVSACGGPNNWRNLLNTLVQGADIAALVAFLAEIAKDPSGEANILAGTMQDIYSAGHSLIDGLLSL